ncbi:MAG: hypothetical protein Q8O16_06445 [Dehalococcoidia bacterium]|nr:hypothetical protein [Dehalococcoidia bacterium]
MTTRLPDMVQAMLDPEIYPDRTSKVELAQTQMSFVFLTDNYVYKVKKPVDLGYLDYTTLDKRHYFCRQEVELNRRLCPEVYLGVVPITRSNGAFTLGGQGEVVDYAVKMRRLPEDRMMNVLLEPQKRRFEPVTEVPPAKHVIIDTSEPLEKQVNTVTERLP